MSILERPRFSESSSIVSNVLEGVSFLQLFREQVHKYPREIIIVDQSRHVTYSELDKKSDLLAKYLRKKG